MDKNYQFVEYLWCDGIGNVRGKTKVLNKPVNDPKDLPIWTFDGSSTGQASGDYSDVFLAPKRIYKDPFRKGHHILVLCECYDNLNCDKPNATNFRSKLVEMCKKTASQEPWVGVEQEYVLFDMKTELPFGWKKHNDPGAGPQGPYYCGNGANKSFGREMATEHMLMCVEAGLHFFGLNAEVMASQWEFQIGTADPLTTADDLWMARYLLARVGEKYEATVTYHPKPYPGDWNGSGGHVNFSTKAMREDGGIKHMEAALERLKLTHKEDMEFYGEDNELRMTGRHETSSMEKFSWGIGNRGASARINKQVSEAGKGYFEDRRPASNLDPYKVFERLLHSIE